MAVFQDEVGAFFIETNFGPAVETTLIELIITCNSSYGALRYVEPMKVSRHYRTLIGSIHATFENGDLALHEAYRSFLKHLWFLTYNIL